jgi:hypothetical protein
VRKEPWLSGNDYLETGEKDFETANIGGKDFLIDLREVAEEGGFASDNVDCESKKRR